MRDAQITVGVNYFGAFYLTQLLLETIKGSAPSRVVWVSSPEESLGDIDWDDLECARCSSATRCALCFLLPCAARVETGVPSPRQLEQSA